MKPILSFLVIFFFLATFSQAQNSFRVMFYNVENLFDTTDNPDTEDNEFTPEGTRHWTKKRYYRKINNIAKVITSIGEWSYPALVGLCEVENDHVLKYLTRYSPIKNAEYRYLITESQDVRGINVALLYQRDRFRYIEHSSVRLSFPDDKDKKTRDILHVSGIIITQDTLDVFICHFPSRRGGAQNTESDRVYAASVLKQKTDSLFNARKNANIIIMGDFNDEPSDKSMTDGLKAYPLGDTITTKRLYNLFLSLEKKSRIGSYKYQGDWNLLDQIIVSGNLLMGDQDFCIHPETVQIFQPDFLFTPDIVQGGKRPKKTFHGYKYEGGFSDHLPVAVDFISKQ
ncbi:MAG: endonuclease [Bacteroidales bacterium]|nr:endonuclease [Bacteroidales bacterium]